MPSEFQFIERLRRRFNKPGKRVIMGIGDDAAVISNWNGRTPAYSGIKLWRYLFPILPQWEQNLYGQQFP
jgi:hypothetical protein